jgi:hypothetical protein
VDKSRIAAAISASKPFLMKALLDALQRAMHANKFDGDYDRTMKRLDKAFHDAVTEVMLEVLDPANPLSQNVRLKKAIRKMATGLPPRD